MDATSGRPPSATWCTGKITLACISFTDVTMGEWIILGPVGIQGHHQSKNIQSSYLLRTVKMVKEKGKGEKRPSNMAGILWTYSIPINIILSHFIRQTCDTVGLSYPITKYARDTVDLFYPRALYSPHTTYARDTVDLSYPGPLVIVTSYTICQGYSGPILSRALINRPIQCQGYSGPILPRALSHLVWYSWDTVRLFHPWSFSPLIRHTWDTGDLFYPWAGISSRRGAWQIKASTILKDKREDLLAINQRRQSR